MTVEIYERNGKKGTTFKVRWFEPGTGIRRQKSFKTKKAALQFWNEIQSDIENNDYFRPEKISYIEWVKQHISNLENARDRKAPKTILGHKQALEALERVCKPKTPHDINPKMIYAFRDKLLDEGKAPRTINKFIEAIRSALSYAMREGIVRRNKLFGKDQGQLRLMLPYQPPRPRILEVGEITTLMKHAAPLPLKVFISLAFYHGMRRGEITWLQWQDINFDANTIEIVDRDSHRTKNRRSRIIAMRRETAELLRELEKDRLNDYLFLDPEKYFHSAGHQFGKLVKLTKIESCTLHDLRKTFNTMVKEAGPYEETALQIMGQSTVSVNRDHYTGTMLNLQRKVIDSLPTIG